MDNSKNNLNEIFIDFYQIKKIFPLFIIIQKFVYLIEIS